MKNRLYTIKETKDWTQLSDSSIRRHVKSGEFPHVKLGSRIMIPGWFLAELLDKNAADAA